MMLWYILRDVKLYSMIWYNVQIKEEWNDETLRKKLKGKKRKDVKIGTLGKLNKDWQSK